MSALDYPGLRPVEAFSVSVENATRIYLRDPQNYATESLLLPPATCFILSHFDGQHSLPDIQEAFTRQFSQVLPGEQLRSLIAQLDACYYLDSERFARLQQGTLAAFRRATVRDMAHADTRYSSQADEFRRQMTGFFGDEQGPGRPGAGGQSGEPLRSLIAPHIDLRVGGPTYAWAYKELAEQSEAELFIVLGTSHTAGTELFVSTCRDYATPLGPVTTDRAFVNALQTNCGHDLFADELLHRTEHSLEFQMLFLKYSLADRQDFTVVPILVSSFHHMIMTWTPPTETPRVTDFLAALRKTIADEGRAVCVVAGVDFAHVGRKFGDQDELTQDVPDWVEAEDRQLIRALENVDPGDFFEQIAKDGDERRGCGFAPMYTMLHLLNAERGRLLRYDRSLDRQTQSSVSFASVAFY